MGIRNAIRTVLLVATPIFAAFLLGPLFLTSASHAGLLYTDGPANGTSNGSEIDSSGFGLVVADSFTLASGAVVSGADFTAWLATGKQGVSVDWAILNGSPGAGGTVLASGTATQHNTFLFNNGFGSDIYNEALSLGTIPLVAGTYWFELKNATISTGTLDELWDINGGPSQAWDNVFGDVTTCPRGTTGAPNNRCSNTFDITGTALAATVPEPSSLALLGAGLAAIGAMRRRKAKQTKPDRPRAKSPNEPT